MDTQSGRIHLRMLILLLFLEAFTQMVTAQTRDSTSLLRHFSGSLYLTNNGISLVPNFSLGEPATMFLGSFGGRRFSLDPDIRFGLDGKPWTMLFWARYKIVPEGKFRLRTGAHLGLNYQKNKVILNDEPKELLVIRRYLAGELAPVVIISENFSIGAYYLYARGLDDGTITNSQFITANASVSNIPLFGRLRFLVEP